MKNKRTLLILVILVLAVLIIVRLDRPKAMPGSQGPGPRDASSQLPELPQQLGGLELVNSYSGQEAVRDVVRLHRSGFRMDDALIAQYEGNGEEMVLWLSVSKTDEEAAELLDLMIQKMPASPVFKEEGSFREGGVDIYHVTGMGMDHFYYRDGLYVVWLAVSAQSPTELLSAFLLTF